MQGVAHLIRFHGNRIKHALLQHLGIKETALTSIRFPRLGNASSISTIEHKGLENITVADLLKTKGDDEAEALFRCCTNDTVYNAVKNMAQHNVGALVVVKPGDQMLIAGIVTERDYLRKIILQGRSSKYTTVGEIMTEENKLITVSSDTNVLHAMRLMTEKRVRHIPVIDKRVVGIISIVDVVREVVEQQHEEVKRLNEFIKGDYY